MAPANEFGGPPGTGAGARRNGGRVWTLVLLAPFLAEVVSGSTRLSVLFVFVPEVMVWGVGALLARECARRWRGGGWSLLLLGLALAVAEEFVIQQTSLAPLPFPGVDAGYGRWAGINWLYFLFMLGYESVFVVLIPVGLTDLFFPQRREQPWLRTRGLIVAAVVFLLGSRIAWFAWTRKARPMLGAPTYHPPLATIGLGCALIVLLIWGAWRLRGAGHSGRTSARRPAGPWLVGLAALVWGAPWWGLITLIFVRHPHPPAGEPIAAGLAWAGIALLVFPWLSAPLGWTDRHRWALCCGAFLACIVPGDLSNAGWPTADLIGKYVFQALGLIGILLLGRALRARKPGPI